MHSSIPMLQNFDHDFAQDFYDPLINTKCTSTQELVWRNV